jgi:multiple sugar transport system substrate-binding protein
MFKFLCCLSILFTSLFYSNNVSSEKISLGVLLSSGGIQRTTYITLIEEFESKNPNINVELIFKPDAEYKKELPHWFAEKKGPDILSWQGGERIYQYIRQGEVQSLQNLWQENNLYKQFSPASIGAVSLNATAYAIPVSYYQWGFYYRQSIFEKLNLAVPTTWDEFITVCSALKQAGTTPLTIGTKFKWPTAAWFDYLNLRINGMKFHQALLKGNESFNDKKVTAVFKKWKQLLDSQYFLEQHNGRNWQEAMPFLYHKYAGMTLMGNFFVGVLPPALRDDFKFFRFPIIDNQVPVYEEAPLDLFMVPSYTTLNDSSKKLLLFLASKPFQEKLNETLGMIPPNMQSRSSNDYFINAGTKTLNIAEGVSQFFDRDTNAAMSGVSMEIFTQFMLDKNIAEAQRKLENARKEHL